MPGERLFILPVPADRQLMEANGVLPIQYVSNSPDFNLMDSTVFGKFTLMSLLSVLFYQKFSKCLLSNNQVHLSKN